jgi:hypothetical protein
MVNMDDKWLAQYKKAFLNFGGMIRDLELCHTPAYWFLHNTIVERVQSLGRQHTSRGKGY